MLFRRHARLQLFSPVEDDVKLWGGGTRTITCRRLRRVPSHNGKDTSVVSRIVLPCVTRPAFKETERPARQRHRIAERKRRMRRDADDCETARCRNVVQLSAVTGPERMMGISVSSSRDLIDRAGRRKRLDVDLPNGPWGAYGTRSIFRQ